MCVRNVGIYVLLLLFQCAQHVNEHVCVCVYERIQTRSNVSIGITLLLFFRVHSRGWSDRCRCCMMRKFGDGYMIRNKENCQ